MKQDGLNVLSEVLKVAPTLHGAGTFSAATLEAMMRHASAQPIRHSAETGSGASTLMFSHLSEHHLVFAMDCGTDSVRGVQRSPLLRAEHVTFVEGPTQLTLPVHTFAHPLQLALIDGPHGYPFPDLEYYYLYPQLEAGALLIVDDIHIPTITHLFEFLKADAMFALQEVVETTAFFRRTAAETFSPTGDGWWMQRYNARAFDSDEAQLVNERPADAQGAPIFYLDSLGPVSNPVSHTGLEVPSGEPLRLVGWALDEGGRCPAAAIELVLDGVRYRAAVRFPRADVATAYGDQAYVRSGFDARLPKGAVSRGRHELELRLILGEGQPVSALVLRFEAV
jgi:hypothetical protein